MKKDKICKLEQVPTLGIDRTSSFWTHMASCVSHPYGIIESSKNQTIKKSRLPTKPPKKSHAEFPSLIKVSESCADNCIINGLIPGP